MKATDNRTEPNSEMQQILTALHEDMLTTGNVTAALVIEKRITEEVNNAGH